MSLIAVGYNEKVVPRSTLVAEYAENPFVRLAELADDFGVAQNTARAWVYAKKFGETPNFIHTPGKRILVRQSAINAAKASNVKFHEEHGEEELTADWTAKPDRANV